MSDKICKKANCTSFNSNKHCDDCKYNNLSSIGDGYFEVTPPKVKKSKEPEIKETVEKKEKVKKEKFKKEKFKKERHPIPTEDDLNEVKEYWMIHAGHITSTVYRSTFVYDNYEDAKQDCMKLAMIAPNKRFYILKTCATYISKVKDSVLEAQEMK